jgi:crotonobetainyl-CoA:carnitine CoA-transferase CaiB-like acyl-CoA transferase
MRPLAGTRVVEIAGLGPGPFCGMLLADLGADVVLVERTEDGRALTDLGSAGIHNRGKRSIAVDLKSEGGIDAVLRIVGRADALIEGMRPGVMEQLGLGPDVCRARNRRLVYGRMTGWGQTGPLAQAAGHDNNYLALSGALWHAGNPGEPPVAPPTLVGDIGGGALYLAVGILAGILNARASGVGTVVDCAIVDGSAHLTNLLLALRGAGQFSSERGQSLLDGPHWFNTYRCGDGNFITVGALEPQFYALLLAKLGLAGDADFVDGYDKTRWPELTARFAALFATRTRDEWCELLEGTDSCFAPVLTPEEAARHPHNAARGVYSERGGLLQANPAPRFDGDIEAARAVRSRGEHTDEIARECGLTATQIVSLRAAGAIR